MAYQVTFNKASDLDIPVKPNWSISLRTFSSYSIDHQKKVDLILFYILLTIRNFTQFPTNICLLKLASSYIMEFKMIFTDGLILDLQCIHNVHVVVQWCRVIRFCDSKYHKGLHFRGLWCFFCMIMTLVKVYISYQIICQWLHYL